MLQNSLTVEGFGKVTLVQGLGSYMEGSTCILGAEAVLQRKQKKIPLNSTLDLEELRTVCPILKSFMIRLNDAGWWDNDRERTRMLAPFHGKLLGTRTDPKQAMSRLLSLLNLAIQEDIKEVVDPEVWQVIEGWVPVSADSAQELQKESTKLFHEDLQPFNAPVLSCLDNAIRGVVIWRGDDDRNLYAANSTSSISTSSEYLLVEKTNDHTNHFIRNRFIQRIKTVYGI